MTVPRALTQQSSPIAKSGTDVTIYCDSQQDADELMKWLCDLSESNTQIIAFLKGLRNEALK